MLGLLRVCLSPHILPVSSVVDVAGWLLSSDLNPADALWYTNYSDRGVNVHTHDRCAAQ